MPANFGNVIRSLVRHEVDFVVLGATAAIAQGAPIGTIDLDLGYRRTRANVKRLVNSLEPFHPRLRGVSESVPFAFTPAAVLRGCNFTLATDAGDVDLLGHITGIGDYRAMTQNAVSLRLFACDVLVMHLGDVIKSKRAAGRPKDKLALPILEETLRLRRSVRNA
jgi:hypothetical protein